MTGAYLVRYPQARITWLVFLGFFDQLIAIPAVFVLAFSFILRLLDGLACLGVTAATGGITEFAHIGGLVFGPSWPSSSMAADRPGWSAGSTQPGMART